MKKGIYAGACVLYLLSFYSINAISELHFALIQKKLPQLEELIKHNEIEEINSASYCTPLPLILATQNEDVRYVNALLGAGADANRIDRSGKTALHCAASMGNIPIIWALLRAGANVNAIYNGKTVLDAAKDEDIHTILQSRPESRQEIEIFCQAKHPRLGERSSAKETPVLALGRIFHFLRLKTEQTS